MYRPLHNCYNFKKEKSLNLSCFSGAWHFTEGRCLHHWLFTGRQATPFSDLCHHSIVHMVWSLQLRFLYELIHFSDCFFTFHWVQHSTVQYSAYRWWCVTGTIIFVIKLAGDLVFVQVKPVSLSCLWMLCSLVCVSCDVCRQLFYFSLSQ